MNETVQHSVAFYEVIDTQLFGWECDQCGVRQFGMESLMEAELEAGFHHSSPVSAEALGLTQDDLRGINTPSEESTEGLQ